MTVNEDQTWALRAACAAAEPDALFVRGAAQRQVRELCFSCEVRMECLADALSSQTSFGVWGGLTERERRALLRRYPEVTDWAAWLRRDDDELVTELREQRAPRIIARARAERTA
ncbi:WhiB family transcriptional regulator [Georgenia subflava]|uniref:Transcriptional regulator WhiB n=1 Tax=Georgenia subflava TaxID=1622177 RepID=A0A6N7EJX8_9MICO|nr:WhiB family transcriptional regulator [Georgenia subflava]MPV37388.1 WhiB family transcriptional regulator [Georgenia subflava]